jgi:hypothetical protein
MLVSILAGRIQIKATLDDKSLRFQAIAETADAAEKIHNLRNVSRTICYYPHIKQFLTNISVIFR